MSQRCLLLTEEIKNLAKQFPNESEGTVKTLVELWQDKTYKSIDIYPSKEELSKFMATLRGSKNNLQQKSSIQINFEEDQNTGYRNRTIKNASADATIAIAMDFESAGEKLTKSSVSNQGKKYIPIDANDLVITKERVNKIVEQLNSINTENYKWSRYSDNGYEVSSSGDKRFSAFYAQLNDGRYIEDIYQLDIKGNGKAVSKSLTDRQNPVRSNIQKTGGFTRTVSREQSWQEYKNLWRQYLKENPSLEKELLEKAKGKVLTDQFATTDVSQARALSEILNEQSKKEISLNIAGNGIYTMKGKYTQQQVDDFTYSLLKAVIESPNLKVKIVSIRTGGQTGFDEAGAKAGIRLGIPTKILAPKGWKFRNIDRQDISNEQQFKDRFNNIVRQTLNTSAQEKSITEKSDFVKKEGTLTTPTLSNLEKVNQINKNFTSQVRRDRVNLISRKFSLIIDNELALQLQLLKDRIALAEPEELIELQQDLDNLNRISIIALKTPRGIFLAIKLNMVEAQEIMERLGDEEEAIAFLKIVDNFELLAEEAARLLLFTEGIAVSFNSRVIEDANINYDNPEGESSVLDGQIDMGVKEESAKDGWMTNFREISSHEALSKEVRKVLNTIPILDKDGYIDTDDLGFDKYISPDLAHAVLIDGLKGMIDNKDLIPALLKLSKKYLWVELVTELLQEDGKLFSLFYQDFMKDFTAYWIQKYKTLPDGTLTIQTIPINFAEGTYYLLDEWRGNLENGTILTKNSIYNKRGELNRENAKLALDDLKELRNKFLNKNNDEKIVLANENLSTIVSILKSVGINPNEGILKLALFDEDKKISPIDDLLNNLDIIVSDVSKGKAEEENKKKGNEDQIDLINTFGSAYNAIALMLSEVTEGAIESSVMQNGKLRYSHTTPNYIGKLMKQLKNENADKKSPDDENTSYFDWFIKTQFMKSDFLYDATNDVWLNEWLNLLTTDPKKRKIFAHKAVVDFNRKEYKDLNDLEYTRALIYEYFGDPESNSTTQTAWYPLPLPSDSPSAEFIRFTRYVNGKELNEDGSYKTYKDILLEKFTNLVTLEYQRMLLIRERAKELKKPLTRARAIKYFDRTENESKFHFLPALNSLVMDDELGTPFLVLLEATQKNGTGEELRTLIHRALNTIIENAFEDTYAEWEEIGLFEETPEGKFAYLTQFKEGLKAHLGRVKNSLLEAKELLGNEWSDEMELVLNAYQLNKPIDDRIALELFDNIYDALIDNVDASVLKRVTNNLNTKFNNSKEALREYFWNTAFAQSLMIQLITTDVAFYKNNIEFYKRIKEYHAPALKLNTSSEYGKSWERTAYLTDEIIQAPSYKFIGEALNLNKALNSIDVSYILTQFQRVNVADAQALRSLDSFRSVMDMSGKWGDKEKQAYENIVNDRWNIEDFNIIWLTIKPYLYTQVFNESNVLGRSPIKTPVQHKNSEFLLMAVNGLVSAVLNKSEKLKAINQFMIDNDIDVIQFESAVKVGGLGNINLKGLNEYKEVYDYLYKATHINGTKEENPNVIHRVSYEDYGIQTATPEHVIDKVQLIGTLMRKLVTSDMPDDPDFRVNVNGKLLTKKEWFNLYNKLNTENILQSFKEVFDIFKDPKKVELVLTDEIRNNARYDIDLIKGLSLDEYGQPNLPYFDPVLTVLIQLLLNSVIKSGHGKATGITKQKIKGGALIQVSDYGLTDELHIVFKSVKADGSEEEITFDSYKQSHKGATNEEYQKWAKEQIKSGKLAIAYYECYMPAYSRKFYEALMTPGTHNLNIGNLPIELRNVIGYRVPTEDKYSMIPLRIKGFLPQLNGSAIMMPAEITTITGSDFDVDKIYVMLPEFTVNNKKSKGLFLKDFRNQLSKEENNKYDNNYLDSTYMEITNGLIAFSEDTVEMKMYDFYQDYNWKKKPTFHKLTYDFNKAPLDLHKDSTTARAIRNNMIMDMMWGVLTNADTAHKMLNPGGFDYAKKAARLIQILEGATYETIKTVFNTSDIMEAYNKLQALDINTLEDIIEKYPEFDGIIDILNSRTQVKMHLKLMIGARMIGIYANHNANHALVQLTDLALDSENGAFTLNGKKYTSLHAIKNENGEYISRNMANPLAASVDNAKDPVLEFLNLNEYTGDASSMIIRVGHTPITMGLLMKQPIIKEIVSYYSKNSRNGVSKKDAVDEVIKRYKKLSDELGEDYSNYKNNKFLDVELARDIFLWKYMKGITDRSLIGNNGDLLDFYKRQVAVGYLFERVMKSGQALADEVAATRSDTSNGGAGPTNAATQMKIQKVLDYIESINKEGSPLINADIIKINLLDNITDINQIRELLLNSPLPIALAFYSLGLEKAESMMSPYFMHYNNSVKDVVNTIRLMTKYDRLDEKTMNLIYNDLITYVLTGTSFFGEDETMTMAQKRNYFINDFPREAEKFIAEHPEEAFTSLNLLKRLKIQRANNKNPIEAFIFKNVGNLSPMLKSNYRNDWESMMYMSDEVLKFALNLVRYSFFRNGMAFGPSSFGHLMPTLIRMNIPLYRDTLFNMLNNETNYAPFIEQFILNHLNLTNLVPRVDAKKAEISFIGKDEKPLNSFEVIIDNNSPSELKRVIKSVDEEIGTKIYNYMGYATLISGRLEVSYKVHRDSQSNNKAIFELVSPMGYINAYVEYEYGKNANEIESQIKVDDTKPYVRRGAFDDGNTKDEEMPNDDRFESIRTQTTEQLKKYMSSLGFDVSNILETKDGKINLNEYKPKEGFTDDENNKIC